MKDLQTMNVQSAEGILEVVKILINLTSPKH